MKSLANIFILGDSYSTFEGCIPEGNWVYYSPASEGHGVTSKEFTWWHKLAAATNSNIVCNDSWSGSTVCNIRYEGEYCPTYSFVGRIDRFIKDGFFEKNKIDTFLIFGGTNDSWANSPIGELMYDGWTDEDLKSTIPAFCYLLSRVKECVPSADITVILNTDLKTEITLNYKKACEKYGVPYIQLENIDKLDGHPTKTGMEQIAEQILAKI